MTQEGKSRAPSRAAAPVSVRQAGGKAGERTGKQSGERADRLRVVHVGTSAQSGAEGPRQRSHDAPARVSGGRQADAGGVRGHLVEEGLECAGQSGLVRRARQFLEQHQLRARVVVTHRHRHIGLARRRFRVHLDSEETPASASTLHSIHVYNNIQHYA